MTRVQRAIALALGAGVIVWAYRRFAQPLLSCARPISTWP